jgi:hypothetical protein
VPEFINPDRDKKLIRHLETIHSDTQSSQRTRGCEFDFELNVVVGWSVVEGE